MKIFAVLFAPLWLANLSPAAAQAVDNQAIVTLAKAGLGDGVIIDKIESSACGYDVSTDALIALKAAGLSDPVISAMVRRCAATAGARGPVGDDSSADPMVWHSPGIYWFAGPPAEQVLQLLRPSASSGVKTSGIGSIAFPTVTRMVIPGVTGQVRVETRSPVFYFYFDPADAKVSDFGMEQSAAAQSPAEFTAVRFRIKNQSRDLQMSKGAYFGSVPVSVRKGIDPRAAIAFETDPVAPGIFKVTLRDLAPGEYAFIFTGANGNARIYDFSVAASAR